MKYEGHSLKRKPVGSVVSMTYPNSTINPKIKQTTTFSVGLCMDLKVQKSDLLTTKQQQYHSILAEKKLDGFYLRCIYKSTSR